MQQSDIQREATLIATLVLAAILLQFLASGIPALDIGGKRSRRLPKSTRQIPFRNRPDLNEPLHEPSDPEAQEAEEQVLELAEEEMEGDG